MAEIRFNLGAIAPHIGDQLPMLSNQTIAAIEGHRRALNRLRVHGFLTPPEARLAEARLVKAIQKALKQKGTD